MREKTRLFIIEGEINSYAPCVNVNASIVSWEPEGKPQALLYGCPTQAPFLTNLAAGFDLEVHHAPCGRPDVYRQENTIIKLRNCSVRRKYFVDPVKMECPWNEIIYLYVLVEADEIEILPENG
jgi:hypothetical protein